MTTLPHDKTTGARERWFLRQPALLLVAIGGAALSPAVAQQAPATMAQALPATPATAEQASSAELRHAPAEALKLPQLHRSGQAAVLTGSPPYAPIRERDDEGRIAEIRMFVGESRVFPAPGIARIAVGNGALLTAAALDEKEVILFANGVGTSSLFMWNADGRYQRVRINIVPGDAARHAREIAAFLAMIPKARASVIGSNVIVEGDELSDADMARIETLAKRYPQIVDFTNRVGWEQMVMMDVKVVEFPVAALRELGLKWGSTGGAAIGGIWAPAHRGHDGPYRVDIRTGQDNAPPITSFDGTPAAIPSSLNAIAFLNLGLNAQLNLLAQEGKAALLAQPQLSARSGSKAAFLAGGEVPYAVSTTEGVRVLFKPYGVKLEISPRVDRNGVIRATIHSEVSSIDRSLTTPGGPALLTRRTQTEFNVRAGETIVLSGLLQRDISTDVDKVPLLGDLPVLGALFRSRRFQNKETELVVFVTPTVVSANSPSMIERIDRATERLEQRMGPSPHLSDPLRPRAGRERPDAQGLAMATDAGAAAAPVAIPATDSTPRTAAPPAFASSPASSPAQAAAPSSNGGIDADTAALPSPRSAGGSLLTVVMPGTVLRAQPATDGAALLTLDRGATVRLGPADSPPAGQQTWRNVIVGTLDGWVPTATVRPAHRGRAHLPPGDAPAGIEQPARLARQPLRATADVTHVGHPLTLAGAALLREPGQYRVLLDGLALRTTPDTNAEVTANLLDGDVVVALAVEPHGRWTAVQFGDGEGATRGWAATQWLLPIASTETGAIPR